MIDVFEVIWKARNDQLKDTLGRVTACQTGVQ
jgi:hypothetical protein